ncbi:MAG: helix-turn-helix domain-containing protein [Sulfurimonas sp.]|jgi:DNA-binding Xre family transcriptional regulator
MRDFYSVIEELKRYLSRDAKKKILDKDVADALGISQANFATLKRRNSMPYENILIFCQKEKLCIRELFFSEL